MISLETLFQKSIDDALAQTYTTLVGKITRVHGATCDVRPVGKVWRWSEGQRVAEALPVLQRVPIAFPHGLSWTLSAGDLVLLVCASNPIDQFTASSSEEPSDDRRHALDDAIALPVAARGASVSGSRLARQTDLEGLRSVVNTLSTSGDPTVSAIFTAFKAAMLSANWPNCSAKVKGS